MTSMTKEPLRFNSTKNFVYIFLQIVAGLFFIGIYFFKTPISQSDVTEFGTVIKTTPQIVSSANAGKSIEFTVTDCIYKMKIEDAGLEALGNRQKFLNDISVGDSVYISIENASYQNVIVHKRKPSLLDGKRIHVYAFRSNSKSYISIHDHNHYKKKEELFGVFIGIGLLVLVLITIIRKIPLSVFLEKYWWLMLVLLILTLLYSRYAFKI